MGKVVCALADGTVAVFRRGPDGQWDLTKYYSVRLGAPNFSVRCLAAVHSKVWCGYKNQIHVLEPRTLTVLVSNLIVHNISTLFSKWKTIIVYSVYRFCS